MKKRMNANVCIPVLLILIGLSCVAYATWSWAGATAWCASYDDGFGDAHASVGWGGMADGSWSAYAEIATGGNAAWGTVSGSGGGSADASGQTNWASSASNISGTGTDGVAYSDSNWDGF